MESKATIDYEQRWQEMAVYVLSKHFVKPDPTPRVLAPLCTNGPIESIESFVPTKRSFKDIKYTHNNTIKGDMRALENWLDMANM